MLAGFCKVLSDGFEVIKESMGFVNFRVCEKVFVAIFEGLVN
jgi:hypothetical protein